MFSSTLHAIFELVVFDFSQTAYASCAAVKLLLVWVHSSFYQLQMFGEEQPWWCTWVSYVLLLPRLLTELQVWRLSIPTRWKSASSTPTCTTAYARGRGRRYRSVSVVLPWIDTSRIVSEEAVEGQKRQSSTSHLQ